MIILKKCLALFKISEFHSSIKRAFISMRKAHYLESQIFQRIDSIKYKQVEFDKYSFSLIEELKKVKKLKIVKPSIKI